VEGDALRRGFATLSESGDVEGDWESVAAGS
jgi:hypothetical protein